MSTTGPLHPEQLTRGETLDRSASGQQQTVAGLLQQFISWVILVISLPLACSSISIFAVLAYSAKKL
jgi:hypothetical protein